MLCDTDASDDDGRPLTLAMPFSDHSDTELVRIPNHSENHIDEVAPATRWSVSVVMESICGNGECLG